MHLKNSQSIQNGSSQKMHTCNHVPTNGGYKSVKERVVINIIYFEASLTEQRIKPTISMQMD